MKTKKAIELVEGDVMTDVGPYGEISSVIVVDSGVQINFVGGGHVIRGEDDLIQVP